MNPLRLAGVSTLLLVCTACTSHLAANRPGGAGVIKAGVSPSTPEEVRAGGYGDADAKKHADIPQPSKGTGTASDNHSDLASKTPNGGKSAVASMTVAPPTAAVPVLEGADIPGADEHKTEKDKGVGDMAGAAKAGSDKSADAAAKDAAGLGAASESDGANRPMDESDPSIDGPPSVTDRRLT